MSDSTPQQQPAAEPAAPRRLRWPTPIEWVILAGGLFLVIHYAWMMDDAYVYFRYADNLLFLKRGLVFNAGEYVEGFSSPLWMVLLILLRLTGLNYWLMTRLVGLLTFGVFWWLLVILNRRLSPPQRPVVNVPLCYLALNYGVLCYFTSGLETPLIQVSAVLYALFVLNPASLVLQVLLAFTPLLRHELAVPFAMCLLWAWARRKKFPWCMIIAGVAITGAWEVFRVYYYADLFPNTFYLKDTSAYAQGLVYLQDTAVPYWLYPLLAASVAFVLICVYADRRRAGAGDDTPLPSREGLGEGLDSRQNNPHPALPLRGGGVVTGSMRLRERLIMLALALPIAFYVIRIGGDPRHYRYLAFPFCLCVCAGAGLIEQVLARFPIRGRRVIGAVAAILIAAGSADALPVATECAPLLWRRDLRDYQQDQRRLRPPPQAEPGAIALEQRCGDGATRRVPRVPSAGT